ncbi:MAG: hypothetical protein RI958_3080 [Actinomycetota bacterium]
MRTRRSSRGDRSGQVSNDRGDTLVEVLAAMTVLSFTSAAMFTALATTSTIAGRERSRVMLDAALRGAAERVVMAGHRCVPGQPLLVEPAWSHGSIEVIVAGPSGAAPMCPTAGPVLGVRVSAAAADGTTSSTEVVLRTLAEVPA